MWGKRICKITISVYRRYFCWRLPFYAADSMNGHHVLYLHDNHQKQKQRKEFHESKNRQYYYLQGSFQTGVYSVLNIHNELMQVLLDVGWIPAALMVMAVVKSFMAKQTGLTKRRRLIQRQNIIRQSLHLLLIFRAWKHLKPCVGTSGIQIRRRLIASAPIAGL